MTDIGVSDAIATERCSRDGSATLTVAAAARVTELVTREHGLTPRTYQLLLMIRTGRQPGRAGIPELEEGLQLGRSTIPELVSRAEAAGLVQRELDRDRRGAISVAITETGRRE